MRMASLLFAMAGTVIMQVRSQASFKFRTIRQQSGTKAVGAHGTISALELSVMHRIINGSVVRNISDQYSFYAMPTNSPATDLWLGCGASIISPTYGLTAAHCFGGGRQHCSGPLEVGLWLGDLHLDGGMISADDHGRHARINATVHCHPLFDGHCSHGHDIVLLELQGALPSWVIPVRLNLDGAGSDHEGTETVNIGFGLTESSSEPTVISQSPSKSMREAKVTILPDEHAGCRSVYAGGYGCSDEFSEGAARNISQQLCAGASDDPPRDTCSGDSGSPMLDSKGVQVGIVSYGGGPGEKMSGPGRICADPNYMGIYTRVSAFSDFIKERVHDLPQ